MKFNASVADQVLEFEDLDGSESSVALMQEEIAKDSYGLMKLNLKPGDVVFDIGAHIGCISIMLSKLYPGIKIYAFEPANITYDFLLKNIKQNNITNIVPVNKAVSGVAGKFDLVFNFKDTCGSSLNYTPAMKQLLLENQWVRQEADCITLEQAFNSFGVDRVQWLKMDCEGSEHSIFEHQLQALSRVDKISMELHLPLSRFAAGPVKLTQEFIEKLHTLPNYPTLDIVNTNWQHDSNG